LTHLPIALVSIEILVHNNYAINPIFQIKLEREDKRIKLTLPYNPTYIKKIKTIPGYRWHPDKKCWSFPYSEDILKKILLLFDGENVASLHFLYKLYSNNLLKCRTKQMQPTQ